MFNGQSARLQNLPINSVEDVKAFLQELQFLLFAKQTVEHFGRVHLKHTASDNGVVGDSALVIEQFNDGGVNTPGANLDSDEAAGIWVKRGTARFDNPTYFRGTPSATFEGDTIFLTPPAVIFRGVASGNWSSGSPPTVAVTESDTGLGAVTVRLASTTTQDPNIRSGETVLFSGCADGNYYALDSHLDGKIGDVKMRVLTTASIPPGWRQLNASGTYNSIGRMIRGADATWSNMGATGGADTQTATFTTAAGGDHNHGGATGASGTLTSSSSGGHTPTGTTASALSSVNSDYATTGITINNTVATLQTTDLGFTTRNDLTLGGAGTALATVGTNPHGHTIDAHNHAITEPNSSTGHRHAVSGLAHTHTITMDAVANHTHTISTFTLSISSSGTHTHTGTTDSFDNRPAFLTLGLIERYE